MLVKMIRMRDYGLCNGSPWLLPFTCMESCKAWLPFLSPYFFIYTHYPQLITSPCPFHQSSSHARYFPSLICLTLSHHHLFHHLPYPFLFITHSFLIQPWYKVTHYVHDKPLFQYPLTRSTIISVFFILLMSLTTYPYPLVTFQNPIPQHTHWTHFFYHYTTFPFNPNASSNSSPLP